MGKPLKTEYLWTSMFNTIETLHKSYHRYYQGPLAELR